jgi:hypothetical protein
VDLTHFAAFGAKRPYAYQALLAHKVHSAHNHGSGGLTPSMQNANSGRETRLQIMLTDRELEVLDDWRFAQRMPSRAAAVRELLRRGLAADGADVPNSSTHSKDFGVESADEA